MTEKELRAQVAHIQLVVKRLMNSDLAGDFTSAFKGGGLEFAQLRRYTPGDDIRSIDWKSSAKMRSIMVKEFVQEKERTVLIALDTSSSLLCSSQEQRKSEYARNVAASLALIAQQANDKVGLLLFSDDIEAYIPPRKGKGHCAHIVRKIFTAQKENTFGVTTNMKKAIESAVAAKIKGGIAFIVSDWITDKQDYVASLPLLAKRYEAVAVRIHDPRERHMPDVGVVSALDPETGETVLIDTRGGANSSLNALLSAHWNDHKRLLKKHRIDVLDIDVGTSFTDSMATFFHSRVH